MSIFSINDLVFAKVRGYSPWPAKIIEINKKFVVYFYGTGEKGFVSLKELFPYIKNKRKFITEKLLRKRKNFSKAVNEIESEVQLRKSLITDNGINEDKNDKNKKCSDCNTSENQHINQIKEENQANSGRKKKVIVLTSKQREMLTTERKICELDAKIHRNLTTEYVNIDECLNCFDEYNSLDVLPLSLKKNPDFVFTITKICNYVGSESIRKMNDQEMNKKIIELKTKARDIFIGFKKLFRCEERYFDVFFKKESSDFLRRTNHLSDKEILLLTDESEIPMVIAE